MHREKLIILADKYLQGDITEQQKQQLHGWYDELNAGREEDIIACEELQSEAEIKYKIWEKLQQRIQRTDTAETRQAHLLSMQKTRIYLFRWAAAAVLFILLSATVYRLLYKDQDHSLQHNEQPLAKAFDNDVLPGTNKAVLTLANGTTILLDSAHNGTQFMQGNAMVCKVASGQLAYKSEKRKEENTEAISYNTLSTPKGGQYQLELPDGTRVWLNAASSIRYPTTFGKKDRMVEMTGEAYFEIARDEKRPFRVRINSMQATATRQGAVIEVLGTHFDVNAYRDDPVATATLLEGAIRLVKGPAVAMLKPGQQARFENAIDDKSTQTHNRITVTDDADVEQVLAWKNGRFEFNGDDIHSVMRQLARWYDVEVSYEGSLPEVNYMGAISREGNLSTVLKMLEFTRSVSFQIKGKKVLVIPFSQTSN